MLVYSTAPCLFLISLQRTGFLTFALFVLRFCLVSFLFVLYCTVLFSTRMCPTFFGWSFGSKSYFTLIFAVLDDDWFPPVGTLLVSVSARVQHLLPPHRPQLSVIHARPWKSSPLSFLLLLPRLSGLCASARTLRAHSWTSSADPHTTCGRIQRHLLRSFVCVINISSERQLNPFICIVSHSRIAVVLRSL